MAQFKRFLVTSTALCAASSAMAGAPTFTDARAFAMGGVGVTAARPAAASFFNPALLAVRQPTSRDGFGMLLPSVSVVASDEEELLDVIDEFEDDYIKPFEQAITDVENSLGGANQAASQQALAESTQRLNDKLADIDGDEVRVDLGVGMSFLFPSASFGAGIFISGSARVSGQPNYSDLDKQNLDDLAGLASSNSINSISDIEQFYDLNDNSQQLNSSARTVGSSYAQVGLAMSHNFRLSGHDYALGFSPKIVDLRAYDYVASVENAEFDDIKDTKVSKSEFNFDLGVASYLDTSEQVLLGLSVINVLPMSIKTRPGYDAVNLPSSDAMPLELELNPTVTAGISYQGESYIVATDVQLTEAKELLNEGDTQYWGVGAEYDLAETFQLRAGAKYNLAESEDLIYTAGFGFTVLGATLELAALSTSDANTAGASLQLGATF
jgi:F plasmid transfer operon, TraF, protein